MKSRSASDRLRWIERELRQLKDDHLLRLPTVRGGPQGVVIRLDGRELINFSSNDYLALAGDPRLSRAVSEELAGCGWGSGASPLVAGRGAEHARLEEKLARFMQTEAAVLFSCGFAANAGTIPALVGRDDAIFSDALNHASLIDGCRLSRAEVHVYPHADCHALAEMLTSVRRSGRRLIVTDGLFSMDGDPAPLAELADLADRFDCMLMVDEAHALGVWGRRGRGVAEAQGVDDRVDVSVGTLSKTLGSAGGFVAGKARLIQWLTNRARSYVFSTAPPQAAAVAAAAALDVVSQRDWPGKALLERADRLRQRLHGEGWDTGAGRGQIIPIVVGSSAHALEISAGLLEQGLYVPAIRPPTVPPGSARLRISLTAGHTEDMISSLVGALGRPDGRSAGT